MKHYKKYSGQKRGRYSRRPMAKVGGKFVPLSYLAAPPKRPRSKWRIEQEEVK